MCRSVRGCGVSCSDGNGDGFLTFDDIFAQYYRVRADRAGVEPFRVLDFIDYASMDIDLSGRITPTQASQLMEWRFSRSPKSERRANSNSSAHIHILPAASSAGAGVDVWKSPQVSFTEFVKQMRIQASLTREI